MPTNSKHGQNFGLCSLNGLFWLANLRFSLFAFSPSHFAIRIYYMGWKVSPSAAKAIGGTFAGFMIRSLKALGSLMCGRVWYHFRFINARARWQICRAFWPLECGQCNANKTFSISQGLRPQETQTEPHRTTIHILISPTLAINCSSHHGNTNFFGFGLWGKRKLAGINKEI